MYLFFAEFSTNPLAYRIYGGLRWGGAVFTGFTVGYRNYEIYVNDAPAPCVHGETSNQQMFRKGKLIGNWADNLLEILTVIPPLSLIDREFRRRYAQCRCAG